MKWCSSPSFAMRIRDPPDGNLHRTGEGIVTRHVLDDVGYGRRFSGSGGLISGRRVPVGRLARGQAGIVTEQHQCGDAAQCDHGASSVVFFAIRTSLHENNSLRRSQPVTVEALLRLRTLGSRSGCLTLLRETWIMAKTSSFDVSTGVDLQEVDNAVNQARKEVAQRYDFKGTDCTLELDRAAASRGARSGRRVPAPGAGPGAAREAGEAEGTPEEPRREQGRGGHLSAGPGRRSRSSRGSTRRRARRSRRTYEERASRRSRCRSRATSYGSSRRRRTRCRRSWPTCVRRTTASS